MTPARKPAAKRKPAASRRRPAAAKTAAAKKVAAARAETTGAPRIAKYRGLELTVPTAAEWGSELYYLVGEMEDRGGSGQLAVSIVRELLGDEQFDLVRAKQRADNVKFVDMENETIELFNAIFSEFGTSLGESEASPGS